MLISPMWRLISTKVFVRGIPVEWDENEISARFSIAGPLERVHFVKSSQGLKTGKVVIEYKEESNAEQEVEGWQDYYGQESQYGQNFLFFPGPPITPPCRIICILLAQIWGHE